MIFNFKKVAKLIRKNIEILFFVFLIVLTIVITSSYNNSKSQTTENYKDTINNVFFKKTINHIFKNLTSRYKSINHKISNGETFNKILSSYSITNDEIIKIKKKLNLDNSLNNLKTDLSIKLTIDKLNDGRVTFFVFPVSRTEKIQLTRNLETDLFKKKIIITNLNRRVVFKEAKILQSLYKTAINLKVQPNIIIEFARIYGFQVDFQRDIRKNDNFQIMYEVFEDDSGKIFETGDIIFADINI